MEDKIFRIKSINILMHMVK